MTCLRHARPLWMAGERAKRGFTLIEVIVTTAIMASIALVVVSSMNSQIISAKRNQCLSNLQMIESAKNAWVGDHPGQTMPTPPFASGTPDPLIQYMRGGVVPNTCPSKPAVSYTSAYDPTQPTYCPFHDQRSYPVLAATPVPTP